MPERDRLPPESTGNLIQVLKEELSRGPKNKTLKGIAHDLDWTIGHLKTYRFGGRTSLEFEDAERLRAYATEHISVLSKTRPASAKRISDTLTLWLGKKSGAPKTSSLDQLAAHFGRVIQTDFARQQSFSERYAGEYFVLRPTLAKGMVVSAMTVKPATMSTTLARYETKRPGKGDMVRCTVGVIYEGGDNIFATGHVLGGHQLRFSLLRRFPTANHPDDMMGLRLGISALDERTELAQRIYCRRIKTTSTAKMLAVCKVYGTLEKAKTALRTMVPDLGMIYDLLTTRLDDDYSLRIALDVVD